MGATALDEHRGTQAGIRVSLIMTPAEQFVGCKPDDTVEAALKLAGGGEFDHLPVLSADGEFLGVFNSHRTTSGGLVSEVYQRISEDLLIGGNSSVIDFIAIASLRQFRVVVSRDGIAGIVTLSDIQRFPARASMFALIMDFEQLITELIATRVGDSIANWGHHLASEDRKRTEGWVKAAQKGRRHVSDLLVAGLREKLVVFEAEFPKMKLPDSDFGERVVKLRNRLAHGDQLGATTRSLARKADTVRDIVDFKDQIEKLLLGGNS